MAYTALLDANVLHPMALCDVLIRLGQEGLYRARWSADILNETVQSIARRKPEIPLERLVRRSAMMNAALADAEVLEYRELLPALGAFGDDAHVVAAAIIGRADVIVTNNLSDFPEEQLRPFNLVAQSADDFLLAQWSLKPATVRKVIEQQAAALRNPPMTVRDVVTFLGKSAPRFAEALLKDLTDKPFRFGA